MEENKKIIRYIIITAIVIFLLIVTLLILNVFILGKIEVNSEVPEIQYQIDGRGIKHSGSKTISGITPGKHLVVAFGKNKQDYISKNYSINVIPGGTTAIKIDLEMTSSNVDFGGDNFNYNSEKVEKFIDTLPIRNELGIISFDYQESQIKISLDGKKSHEDALGWLKSNNINVTDDLIIWGDLLSPD